MYFKIYFLITLIGTLVNCGMAQIQLLNDEFNNSESIINWKNINETEQWGIQQLERLDINTSRADHLQLMPYRFLVWRLSRAINL